MGYEAECRIRFDGRNAAGKAHLETTDLVFRGPFRLGVPLAQITSAVASDGWLVVSFDGQRAEFELGSAAVRWAARITSPPSRLQKLGVKPGMLVLAVGVDNDEGFLDEVRGAGARVVARLEPGRADLAFYGVARREKLDRLADLATRIKPDGAVWVLRPKGVQSITEADVMAAGKRVGLVDVKVASFSQTLTAEKFVIPVARRGSKATPRSIEPARGKRKASRDE